MKNELFGGKLKLLELVAFESFFYKSLIVTFYWKEKLPKKLYRELLKVQF
jgi:hypothetical protein